MFEHFSEKELAILEKRARRIAAAKADDDSLVTFSVLRCRVGTEWYAVPLEEMSAIYRGAAIVPVPGAPGYLKGITNVRGRILSVIGLADVLDVPTGKTSSGEIIVVEYDDQMVALLVDQVDNVAAYAEADIEAAPYENETGQTLYVLPDGTLILHIEPLLNDADLVIDGS